MIIIINLWWQVCSLAIILVQYSISLTPIETTKSLLELLFLLLTDINESISLCLNFLLFLLFEWNGFKSIQVVVLNILQPVLLFSNPSDNKDKYRICSLLRYWSETSFLLNLLLSLSYPKYFNSFEFNILNNLWPKIYPEPKI